MQVLGIDIGGTGVKGAPVDTETGEMLAERFRMDTPEPATPEAVVNTIGEIVRHFNWNEPIGCGYPGVIKKGVVHTAANVDDSWIGYDLQQGLERLTNNPVCVINDADAAGLAEMKFGAGRGRDGLVMMITLGTGIGTAGFLNGELVPNLELGHIEIKGRDAELRAAYSARERDALSWKKWSKRVDRYLYTLQTLLYPDLFIIGGGVSKKWDKFVPRLQRVTVEIVPAQMRNEAGIIGAAIGACIVAE
jgi:polyphosphate glucokinase